MRNISAWDDIDLPWRAAHPPFLVRVPQPDKDTLGVLSAYMQAICKMQIACKVFFLNEREESTAKRKEQPWIAHY